MIIVKEHRYFFQSKLPSANLARWIIELPFTFNQPTAKSFFVYFAQPLSMKSPDFGDHGKGNNEHDLAH